MYDWVLRGKNLHAFYKKVRPFSVEKGVQLDLALAAEQWGRKTEAHKCLDRMLKDRKRTNYAY